MPVQPILHPKLGWSLDQRDPKFIAALMPLWGWLYRYYFRVQTSGWQHIPAHGNVLLVGSHNGGLAAPDMFMMMHDWFKLFGYQRLAYGLMHPLIWQGCPPVAELAAKMGAVMAHPKVAIAALRRKASVLVYPGGAQDLFRPHSLRNQICLGDNRAFIKVALQEQVPIVPVISHGAHDTLIVLADCYKQAQQLHEWGMPWILGLDPTVFPIYLGLPWGLGIGPLPNIPLPVPIHTRVCPAIVFERYGRAVARDRDYVSECYETVRTQMQQELNRLIQSVEVGQSVKPKATWH